MPARIAVRLSLATVAALALGVAMVWPWPAPEVDWRSPLNAALSQNDCERVAAIANAAVTAGSLEAYDLLAAPTNLGACSDTATLQIPPPGFAAHLRSRRSDASILDRHTLRERTEALDFWARHYVRAIDFTCRQPYDLDLHTDNVALSAALPEITGGWVYAAHRQRRSVCADVVTALATSLAARNEPSAKELAFEFAGAGPIAESPAARLIAARLVLEDQFIPLRAARTDPRLLSLMRSNEWRSLVSLAAANDPRAVELVILLLHQGRFAENATSFIGLQRDPYFWILRGRRLKLPDQPFYAEIENGLDSERRANCRAEEERDWADQRAARTARP